MIYQVTTTQRPSSSSSGWNSQCGHFGDATRTEEVFWFLGLRYCIGHWDRKSVLIIKCVLTLGAEILHWALGHRGFYCIIWGRHCCIAVILPSLLTQHNLIVLTFPPRAWWCWELCKHYNTITWSVALQACAQTRWCWVCGPGLPPHPLEGRNGWWLQPVYVIESKLAAKYLLHFVIGNCKAFFLVSSNELEVLANYFFLENWTFPSASMSRSSLNLLYVCVSRR